MFIDEDKLEITLSTGQLTMDGKVRPIVKVRESGKAYAVITQEPLGGLRFETGYLPGDHPALEVVEKMFLRHNSWLGGREILPGLRFVRFPGDTITVGIIGCGKSKRDHATFAAEMYSSGYFTQCRRWVEAFTDDWAIVSAKHRLLPPDQMIEPYEETLTAEKIRAWSSTVSYEAYMRWGEDTHYVVLAGQDYTKPWTEFNTRNLPATFPMEGMGLPKRKGWLRRQLEGL